MEPQGTRWRTFLLGTSQTPVLGPFPASAVHALADLGLTDIEIARYLGSHPLRIARLRRLVTPERKIAWSVTDPVMAHDAQPRRRARPGWQLLR